MHDISKQLAHRKGCARALLADGSHTECPAFAQVAVEWRDAYTFACMLRADSILQSASCSAAQSTSSDRQAGMCHQHTDMHGDCRCCYRLSNVHGMPFSVCAGVTSAPTPPSADMPEQPVMQPAVGAAAMQDALKHLDMAALMGGPALRPALDAAVAQVQTMMRAVSNTGAAAKAQVDFNFDSQQPADGVTTAQGTADTGSAACAQQQSPPAKRQRTDHALDVSQPPGIEACANGRMAEDAGLPHHRRPPCVDSNRTERRRAECYTDAVSEQAADMWPSGPAFMAVPPAGSLRGEAIATAELPSLERQEHLYCRYANEQLPCTSRQQASCKLCRHCCHAYAAKERKAGNYAAGSCAITCLRAVAAGRSSSQASSLRPLLADLHTQSALFARPHHLRRYQVHDPN